MLLNTTHFNKENNNLIDNKVGKAYTFFQSIKLKGIGSKRMVIDKVSPNLASVINKIADVNYGNIELRPNGIIVHITKGQKNFAWVIPLYQLVIYKTDGTSIHANGRFVNFKNNKTFKENKAFFDKLTHIKVEYDKQYNFTNLE